MKKSKRFTPKQDRQAEHVAASERARGKDAKTARSIGYAVASKQAHKGPTKRSKGKAVRY